MVDILMDPKNRKLMEGKKKKTRARKTRKPVEKGKIAKFLVIIDKFKDTDGGKRKRTEKDDAEPDDIDHPEVARDDLDGKLDMTCKKMKFGWPKSGIEEYPPHFVHGNRNLVICPLLTSQL